MKFKMFDTNRPDLLGGSYLILAERADQLILRVPVGKGMEGRKPKEYSIDWNIYIEDLSLWNRTTIVNVGEGRRMCGECYEDTNLK
jgi:hypothetical protein